MVNWNRRTRNALFMATVFVPYARKQPALLMEKAAERIRTDNRWYGFVSKILSTLAAGLRRFTHAARAKPGDERVISDGERFDRVIYESKQLASNSSPNGDLRDLSVIFVLNNSLPWTRSGYTFRTHKIARGLANRGIKVVAVTRYGYPLSVGRFGAESSDTVDGIKYYRILPRWFHRRSTERDRYAVNTVKRIAQENGVTVVCATTGYENAIVASTVSHELGLPWVYEVRGEPESTWLARQPDATEAKATTYYVKSREMETKAMLQATGVIALSQVSKATLVERGVPEYKIRVHPNGVDSSLVDRPFEKDELRVELGLPLDRKIVGSISSLVAYEGFDTLILALHHLPTEWCVLLVGEGVDRLRLQRLVEREGLKDRVHFAGHQPEEIIWKWYAVLDVFAVPRIDTEVCRTVTPMKPVTAIGLGVPVVGSDLPALREVTGGFAQYSRPGDPRMLAEMIVRASAQGLPESAKQWVRFRTWDSVSGEYARTLKECEGGLIAG